ncbi:MAG: hypothetical protein LBE91_12830 [Tannerella sp.]|jgi:hypothetical protein|nr:hypothetical protein [Tannerella sp.]
MKKNIKILLLLTAILFAVLTGCSVNGGIVNEQEDSPWEISPDTESQVIEKEIDGIAFKFCLLNGQGEPATVFREGENFRFYFSIVNKTDENLFFIPDFAQAEKNGFCEVFTSNKQSIGKPFVFRGVDLIGIGAYPFKPEESCVFDLSWVDSRDSVWRWKYGYYESNRQIPLPEGDYFTEFQSRFQFEKEGSNYLNSKDSPYNYLDSILIFKINFKIQ